MDYIEKWVDRSGHRIYTRDYPGDGPAIVLLHGFPDNLHLYDRLQPLLVEQGRRVVTFDFLGWGESDKPANYPYTATNQTGDLAAVIDQLGLDDVTLVAHDASGPPAIDWSLDHPERVTSLVLLNTYYCAMPTLRAPEAILLYSLPLVRIVARTVARAFEGWDRRLYYWQVGRFVSDPAVRAELVPYLYQQFRPARPAFWTLNNDLLGTVRSRTKQIPRLRAFDRPVRIIFGAADPYLNRGVARRFHELFPTSELHLWPMPAITCRSTSPRRWPISFLPRQRHDATGPHGRRVEAVKAGK